MIHTPSNIKSYKKEIKQALENSFLNETLENFGASYKISRENAFKGIDFDELKNAIAKAKDEALPRLDELFEEFKKNAEKAGVKVHLAKNAGEANEIISRIANENDVKNIVKSKSMTAEETFLNDHLEKEGFVVTETDLGEWIIQLRKEGPSHMVMPAIHLSRKEVAELFTKVTGKNQDPDNIGKMVKVARKKLRKAFFEADMGISGANFAISKTGAIGIISNEGNARLTTTLPRVHVALAGIDKLVPDLSSALRILKVLPKNATGQAISSYVTWLKGAVECGSAPENKKIMHLVFLDNGRGELAKDPVFSQALRCIRCGACANVCPIYRLLGGHRYGHVYIGAIGLILTLFYHGRENARAIVTNCLNCQACKSVCPSGIDLPYLIKKTYKTVLEQEKNKPAKNILLSKVMKNRRLFHLLLRQAWLVQAPLKDNQGFIRHLPQFFEKDHGFRSLPAITHLPFRDRWNKINKNIARPEFKVAFFGGCAMDFIYPEQGEALVRLLNNFNVALDYPMDQTCCGLPALMAAEEETAKEIAIQNLHAVNPEKYDYIVTLCASCGSHLKENFPKIFCNDPDFMDKVNEFAGKVIDISSFLINVLKAGSEKFSFSGKKVAYHSPCHLCRGLGVAKEPRKLIKTAGFEYVPYDNEDVCCGFGGSYSIEYPEISSKILDKKLKNVEKTKAEILVTDCPGCVLQLRGGLHKKASDIKVKHIVELVSSYFIAKK